MSETRPFITEFAERISGSNFINGEWVPAGSGSLEVSDPSRGTTLGTVPNSTPDDVDRAVRAARSAQGAWASRTYADRSALLLKVATLLEQHAEEFAVIEAVDAGKPITTMRDEEVPGMVDTIRFYAGAVRTLPAMAGGDYLEGLSSVVRREPLGVVAAITPWNYPLQQAIAKLTPALATGNTVVIKPAETTPYATARFVELAAQVLPAGVLNVVFGTGAVAGDALTRHSDVNVVSFTGSIATGRRIGAIAGEGIKKCILELGGNAPVLVFADADVQRAAAVIVAGGLYNTGQECMASSRVIAHESIVDELADAMRREARTFRVGDVLDPSTTLAPLNSEQQLQRIRTKLQQASDVANVEYLGDVPPDGGYFLGPVLVSGAEQSHDIVAEEIFGPVFTLQSFSSESEALALANGTNFGLAASVFTRDVGVATRVQNTLHFGTVWVNNHLVFAADLPVSGFRDSGMGTENAQQGILEYTRVKHIMVDHQN